MEIAVVGAAASISLDDDGSVVDGRLALAAVAPTIVEVEGLDLASATHGPKPPRRPPPRRGKRPDRSATSVRAMYTGRT